VSDLKREEVEAYLQGLFSAPAKVCSMTVLGSDRGAKDIKSYGYGTPVKVEYQFGGSERRAAVLHTMQPGRFGHEHMADRARELIWDHQAFNHLPRHVGSLDVGGFQGDGQLISIGKVEEFCLLTDYVEGESYSHDLERLRDGGELTEDDLRRADLLCDYLGGDS
jgi:hypothetical protein